MKIRSIFRNKKYNRRKAVKYARKYALNPKPGDVHFEENDCANFVSLALRAGGMPMEGVRWDSIDSWFCNTSNSKELTKISLSWRAAKFFRRYWGKDNISKKVRAKNYREVKVRDALINYEDIEKSVQLGDVIQHINTKKSNYPYHTQIITNKKHNSKYSVNDIYISQHTANARDISLYEYMLKIKDKDSQYICIYNM